MSTKLTCNSTFGEVVKASQENNINLRLYPEAYRYIKVSFYCPAHKLATAVQAIIDADPLDKNQEEGGER